MYLVKKSRESLIEIIVYTAGQTIMLPPGSNKIVNICCIWATSLNYSIFKRIFINTSLTL